MKYIINDVHLNLETSRSGEVQKNKNKMYIWIKDESIMENIIKRRNRPYNDYKVHVIPSVMEKIKHLDKKAYSLLKNTKWRWNKNCGCSMCPCSPGFIGDTLGMYDIHVDITIKNDTKHLEVKDYNRYRKFDYNNHPNVNFNLGELLYKPEDKEIGVVIQLHDDGDCRTDMWGNCSLSEVSFATMEQIKEFRPELLLHLKP